MVFLFYLFILNRLFAGSTFAATSPTNLEARSHNTTSTITKSCNKLLNMDADAAKIARESLELAFQMSNILDTGLDHHTLSILIALCDLGLNPEALAAVVKELRREVIPLAPSDAARPVL
ncbi:hypothetical protein ACFX13_006584 [Malus domestica]